MITTKEMFTKFKQFVDHGDFGVEESEPFAFWHWLELAHEREGDVWAEMGVQDVEDFYAVLKLAWQDEMPHKDALRGGHLAARVPWAEESFPVNHL